MSFSPIVIVNDALQQVTILIKHLVRRYSRLASMSTESIRITQTKPSMQYLLNLLWIGQLLLLRLHHHARWRRTGGARHGAANFARRWHTWWWWWRSWWPATLLLSTIRRRRHCSGDVVILSNSTKNFESKDVTNVARNDYLVVWRSFSVSMCEREGSTRRNICVCVCLKRGRDNTMAWRLFPQHPLPRWRLFPLGRVVAMPSVCMSLCAFVHSLSLSLSTHHCACLKSHYLLGVFTFIPRVFAPAHQNLVCMHPPPTELSVDLNLYICLNFRHWCSTFRSSNIR